MRSAMLFPSWLHPIPDPSSQRWIPGGGEWIRFDLPGAQLRLAEGKTINIDETTPVVAVVFPS